jgi:hypothetical protein
MIQKNCGQLSGLLIGIGRFAEVVAPILIGLGMLACLLNERPASISYKASGVLNRHEFRFPFLLLREYNTSVQLKLYGSVESFVVLYRLKSKGRIN